MGIRPEQVDILKPYTYEEFEAHVDAALSTMQHVRQNSPGVYVIYSFSGPGRLNAERFKLSVNMYKDKYAEENGWSMFTSTASGTGLVLRKPLWPRKGNK